MYKSVSSVSVAIVAAICITTAYAKKPETVMGSYEERLAHIELALKDMKKTFGSKCPKVDSYLKELKNFHTAEILGEVAKVSEAKKKHEREMQDFKKARSKELRAKQDQLKDDHNARYKVGQVFNAETSELERKLLRKQAADLNAVSDVYERLMAFQQKALLDNPLLDFDKILCIRREYGSDARTYEMNSCVPRFNSYNLNWVKPGDHPSELVALSGLRKSKKTLRQICTLEGKLAIAEIDLNYDGKRILFSGGRSSCLEKKGNASSMRWGLYQVNEEGGDLKVVQEHDEYNSFDAAYFADDNIIFNSTASIQGLPCEGGPAPTTDMYKLDVKSGKIKRLTFDQDGNWSPTMMENGRVMFLRWEYSDLPHYFSRILMTMNPDGTGQIAHYGSNSYWPNHLADSRPIPGQSSRFISVVTGHHDSRPGQMALFDVRKGRERTNGLVTEIPGWGRDVPYAMVDSLYKERMPETLAPYPLGTSPSNGAGRYFLAAARLQGDGLWGIYLVDLWGNFTLIHEEEGYAMAEPIPLVARKRPPVLPDRTNPKSETATVYIQNIYEGPGLKNIPRGKVKTLRLFTYHYAYLRSGGHAAIGLESSWDVKRVLGTVPVNEDGSASFTVPAQIPIAIQPLNEKGEALQLMRSWFLGMRGEFVSCIGCHESQNMAPVAAVGSKASRQTPSKVKEWYGPERGFAFMREIQPILDRKCIGCHDGTQRSKKGVPMPNFDNVDLQTVKHDDGKGRDGPFYQSYIAFCKFFRRPGPESDAHMFNPMEYHISTTIGWQLLSKGHHGVTLNNEEKDRIVTWHDLNGPCFGTYMEAQRRYKETTRENQDDAYVKINKSSYNAIKEGREIRNRLMKEYDGLTNDGEADALPLAETVAAREAFKKQNPAIVPEAVGLRRIKYRSPEGWPFDAAKALELQQAGGKKDLELKLKGSSMKFKYIPAGAFVMGQEGGYRDEVAHAIRIEKGFYMLDKEVTNDLYEQYDSEHDNGFVDLLGKDHGSGGLDMTADEFATVRVSWQEAQAFCKWLSDKLGKSVRLPTEAEWEYAARAGTGTPFFWGVEAGDFASYANFADKSMEQFRSGWTHNHLLRDWDVDDKNMAVGVYRKGNIGRSHPLKTKPNAFGLYNMLGNVSEWTSSDYVEYPYSGKSESGSIDVKKVSRGGSWKQLPRWATASYRTAYETHQRVYNVGIRLVVEDTEQK